MRRHGRVKSEYGCPVGVATQLMLIALVRNATTRGAYWGSTLTNCNASTL
jgi:hypothetical protein